MTWLLVDWQGPYDTWSPLAALVVVALAASFLFELIVVAAIKRLAARTKTDVDDLVVRAIHPALVLLVFVIIVWVGVKYYLTTLPPAAERAIEDAAFAITALILAISAARLFYGMFKRRAKRRAELAGMAALGGRVTSVVVYTVAFLIVLDHYGVSITPLLTTAGLAGLAVALALQDTLANFFAGIWIQTGRTMRPGHFVRLEDQKIEGFVADIGWRTTKIHTLPGNLVVVPNQTVAQSTITDYSLPEPKMGTSLTVVTGLETDPDRVVPMILEEIRAAQNDVDYILKEPEPFCRLNKRVDEGWEFWMSFWIPYYYNQWNAQGHVLNRIRKRFLKEGIRMPYPIRETVMVPSQRADVAQSFPGGPGAESRGPDPAR